MLHLLIIQKYRFGATRTGWPLDSAPWWVTVAKNNEVVRVDPARNVCRRGLA